MFAMASAPSKNEHLKRNTTEKRIQIIYGTCAVATAPLKKQNLTTVN